MCVGVVESSSGVVGDPTVDSFRDSDTYPAGIASGPDPTRRALHIIITPRTGGDELRSSEIYVRPGRVIHSTRLDVQAHITTPSRPDLGQREGVARWLVVKHPHLWVGAHIHEGFVAVEDCGATTTGRWVGRTGPGGAVVVELGLVREDDGVGNGLGFWSWGGENGKGEKKRGQERGGRGSAAA